MKSNIYNLGRPVLTTCSKEYATLGVDKMILIPTRGGFLGAKNYFDGEDTITSSCGGIDYDNDFFKE